MPRGFVLSTSVCILLLGCEGISIESNYDTSIVGYVSEVACLDFRGTNFRMNDGRNPPINFGWLSQTGSTSVWHAKGGTSWSISWYQKALLCVDGSDSSNRFLLNPVTLAAPKAKLNKVWSKVREEWELAK